MIQQQWMCFQFPYGFKLQFCLRLDERILGIFYLIQTIKVTYDSSRDGKQKLVSHWIITLYTQKEVMKSYTGFTVLGHHS
jgi:hypothetical protein